jgi:putative peptide zinc metalloprotease protein
MNLSEVLNVALPELPARRAKSYPRLHPKLVMREHVEDGALTMVAAISGVSFLYRFNPDQWAIAQLFDGQRSYAQIAELYQQQSNNLLNESWVRDFADALDELEFWYKTPLEKNVTASQKVAETRQREIKKKSVDLALIIVASWDPDVHLTRLYKYANFVYRRWFVLSTLVLFAIMGLVFARGLSEIWRDTVEYYTFTDKGVADLAEFWLLFFGLGFFHETAHALTCKHYGGGVHKTGFMLLYLTPCFFAEITEVYVYGSKWQRISAIFAGIWVELIFCSVASIVWWGTPAGSPAHDFAYKVMLITGVAVVLMNLNPLMKLDGYYLFSELIDISTLKESSTEYVSSWVKYNIFRLPIEVPYLRRRRRWLFVGYAILSGAYSYVVLFAVVRLSYNISKHFTMQWAFLPAAILAFLIFRARLRSSWRFMRDFYLDKKQHLRARLGSPRSLLVGAVILIGLFMPVWRETVSGRFVLEPLQRAVLRASVPGSVTAVMATEGMHVDAGSPLVTLRNISLESKRDNTQANLHFAAVQSRRAQLNYHDMAHANNENIYELKRFHEASQEFKALKVVSPIAGSIVTPTPENLLGSIVDPGNPLIEVDDFGVMKARIFIPEFQVPKILPTAEVSLKFAYRFLPIRGRISSILPSSSGIDPGLIHEDKYEGLAAPLYYVAVVQLVNLDGSLMPGMSGDAKIYVGRRSLAGFMWKNVRDFAKRKIW